MKLIPETVPLELEVPNVHLKWLFFCILSFLNTYSCCLQHPIISSQEGEGVVSVDCSAGLTAVCTSFGKVYTMG